MSGDRRPTMPPVRLPSDAELARDALSTPLLSRAARLARWAGTGVPVGAGGELLSDQVPAAVDALGPCTGHTTRTDTPVDPVTDVTDAWNLAVDLGLVEIEEGDGGEPARGADTPGTETTASDGEPEKAAGVARTGKELARLTGGGPSEVLRTWKAGLETVLADAATPGFDELLGGLEQLTADGAPLDPQKLDLSALEWDADEEQRFLDSVLANLYRLTATDPQASAGAMVPLPVLAASMVVPPDMGEPTDEVLEEVSVAMMKLDGQFRLLDPVGLVAYQPVDESFLGEASPADPAGAGSAELSGDGGMGGVPEEDLTRYGMVRLTPLGLYGLRDRLLDSGVWAPVVGELADKGAEVLLDTLPGYPEAAAQAEVEQWLAGRPVLAAARELLSAARGDDPGAPGRRLHCQQALSLVGAEAEPALREVLEDAQLGGLARVWLVEHGAVDVPPPGGEMVFWLTVDTLAAQLAADGGSAELRELVRGLIDQHAGFFDRIWRVRHPAVAEVLEAMGRLHPDRGIAKEARKAAFKARSGAAR